MDGELDMDAAHKMLSDKVKLLAVTAVSNVTGTVVDIETLIAWAKEYEISVYIDAAQAVRHRIFEMCIRDRYCTMWNSCRRRNWIIA